MVVARKKGKGAADKDWGYTFGCNGTYNELQVRALMGNAGSSTVDRRVAARLIRKGKEVGRSVYCKRSVDEYIASLEM